MTYLLIALTILAFEGLARLLFDASAWMWYTAALAVSVGILLLASPAQWYFAAGPVGGSVLLRHLDDYLIVRADAARSSFRR